MLKYLSFYTGVYDSNIGMNTNSKYGILAFMSLIQSGHPNLAKKSTPSALVQSTIGNIALFFIGKQFKPKS